jgi:hypothetical protein
VRYLKFFTERTVQRQKLNMSSYIEPPVYYLARILVGQRNLVLNVTLKFNMSFVGSSRTWPSQIPKQPKTSIAGWSLILPMSQEGLDCTELLTREPLSSVRIELRRWVTKNLIIPTMSPLVQDVLSGTCYSQELETTVETHSKGLN